MDQVDEANNLGNAVVDRETEQVPIDRQMKGFLPPSKTIPTSPRSGLSQTKRITVRRLKLNQFDSEIR